jgi:DNA-binding IclR family transcriptional regulator
MTTLAKTCNQTISLGILDDFDVVYIGIDHAQREVGIQGNIGGRHPAHATALGKVMLAALAEEALEARLAGRELKRLTHRTIVAKDMLLDRLAQVRRDGYALDDEERGIGIRCIAAPIRDYTGTVIAALSLAGPIFFMPDEVMESYKTHLLKAVSDISERLGYREASSSISV